jgi:hypothetical protein
MTITVPRILLVIALALLIMSLVCLLVPTTIAGAGWSVWLVSAFIAWLLDAAFFAGHA